MAGQQKRKPKLPNKILVGGRKDYIVSTEDHIQANGHDLDGLCDDGIQQIYVLNGLHQDREKEILIHELLHACWSERNLFTNDAAAKVEEEVVTHLASSLAATFKTNRKLMEYLSG